MAGDSGGGSKLKVDVDAWRRTAGARGFLRVPAKQKPSRDALLVNSKDVDETLARRATVVKATYRHPYQMHGSMGSSCAVADVQGDKSDDLVGDPGLCIRRRSGVAMLLGLTPENVRVIFRRGSGCYGINGADTVSYDAALLSQAVGKPVRVQLTRKDEMAWENYGFAFVIDQRAGVDATGQHRRRGITKPGRRRSAAGPGTTTPGNVVTGMLAGFPPEPFTPREAARPSRRTFNNEQQRRAVLRAGCVGGTCGGTGTITQRARAGAHRGVAVFDRPAAIAGAAAEHVRARVFHGRDWRRT